MRGILNKIEKTKERTKENIEYVIFVLKYKKVNLSTKILIVLTLAYILSPIDLIPDFVPILGYVDDIIVIPFLLWLCIKSIPNKYKEEFKIMKADNSLPKEGKINFNNLKVIGAFIITITWGIIIIVIILIVKGGVR